MAGAGFQLLMARPRYSNINVGFAKLLMGFDTGADGSQVFSDESVAARAGVTFNGSAAISAAQAKFGPSSLVLDGADDWLRWPDSDDWYFGALPFTVDLWVRPATSVAGSRALIGQAVDLNAGAIGSSWCLNQFNGGIYFSFYDPALDTWRNMTGGAPLVVDTWTHIAVDRDHAGKIRLYRDGVMIDSYAYAGELRQVSTTLNIGVTADGGNDYSGHLDEIRILKGRAAWASNAGFVPPAAAYPRA